MRITCPHCGERGLAEFLYHGDASVRRPQNGGVLSDEWSDYVYLRENPSGAHRELWYHAAGCQAWLVVTRNLTTHQIDGVESSLQS